MKKIINIGIFAHVDAGKTSLTEALYEHTHDKYQKGTIKGGTTLTDSLELEKERGITIKTAGVSFAWKGIKVNLLDTPGHVDFYSEVIRTLETIDIAILVVASNDKLQPQTRKIFSHLSEAKIPTILFLNKVDLATADVEKITEEIREKMTTKLIPYEHLKLKNTQEQLIEANENILEKYLAGEHISDEEISKEFYAQFLSRKCFPVIKGSAVSGLGITQILNILYKCTNDIFKPSNKLSGFVYKVDFINKRKQTYLKLVSGQLNKNETVILNSNRTIKISNLFKLQDDIFVPTDKVEQNDIFMIPNDSVFKIDDYIGEAIRRSVRISPSDLKIVFSIDENERFILLNLLEELNQEDPLLNLEIDQETGEISIHIFGNVQKEVIEESLRRAYPFISLRLLPPSIIYHEVPRKKGIGELVMQEPINPYWATMTIQVTPNEKLGIRFDSLVSTGYLKQSFQHAVYQGLEQSLAEGLYGYPLNDMDITLTEAEFFSPVSTPSEFRKLAPYALYKALLDADTYIVEPVVCIELFIQKKYTGSAVSELGKLDGKILEMTEKKSEVLIKAKLLQSKFIVFESQLNEWFKGTAYLKNYVKGFEKTTESILYEQGNIDRIKAMLIKDLN